MKHPQNAVVGYGFFAVFSLLPVQMAWLAFEERNGDVSFDGFLNRIAEYRHESPVETAINSRPVGCIVLRDVALLPPSMWLPWGKDEEWSPNIVAYKGHDLTTGPGTRLADLLANGRPPEFQSNFELVLGDNRSRADATVTQREGQGAFRLRVLDAYDRRCSVTGERSLPVLEAAHIQQYLGPASNHVQNGLSLRADIHRLFDTGYVTVTPDLRFEVSRRLKDDYENGKEYYELAGRHLLVLPGRPSLHPSGKALEWHANNVFRG